VKESIVVRGARQHNLKGFDVEIPRRTVTVITGPSGSGKSSLAFDTIYAEGQRRYVESLSSYARQFLERMEKPDVDSVEGLSPAVAIEQKNPTKTSRSTVGTATEIYDYLRLLWARIGRTYCPNCGREIKPDTVSSVTDRVLSLPSGTRFYVTFPLRLSNKVTHEVVIENLRAQGFLRVAIDGLVMHLDELAESKRDITRAKELLVVVDRLVASPEASGRLSDAVGVAFAEGEGDCIIVFNEPVISPLDGLTVSKLAFTERFQCPDDGTVAPAPTPQLFSFNNPRGACSQCNGFGAILEYDETLMIPYPSRSLRDGAIDPWTKPRYDNKRRALAEFAKRERIPMDRPWEQLTAAHRQLLLHSRTRGYKGIIPFMRDLEEKRYKQYIRVFLRQYQTAQECPRCHGTKLQPEALNVRVGGLNIAQVSELPVDELAIWLNELRLTEFETRVAEMILKESRDRVTFLRDVGLGYLSMNRATRTLSGGEAQRIGLANSLGSHLVDTLYVLDEPSIGLHSRDMDRLLKLLQRLRDAGNSVLVVEHDLAAIEMADYMVELGPGSGEAGGEIVFAGPMSRIAESPLTGQYVTGARTIPLPSERRRLGPRWITLTGAREHNLQNVDVRIPLGALTVVTGVSGSGKSTLVHDVLYRALETHLVGEHSAKLHLGEKVGEYETITGFDALDDVVMIDQSPIGKSPRSNPVTYVKAFDEIRSIFADTPLARQRKYTPGTFSFNVEGGRCEGCEGAGALEVEMVFMADVFVPCDECGGKRYKPEVLDVTVRGKNIHEVLNMTVREAMHHFASASKVADKLRVLEEVGLGYLRLGQSATTLSGGEAQRVKLAAHLQPATSSSRAGNAPRRQQILYIFDEPTTGLHFDDISKLLSAFRRLIEAGGSILLIEHNLEVIKTADWVIDLGPEGGERGGRIVGEGPPERIAKIPASYTGGFLARVLEENGASRGNGEK